MVIEPAHVTQLLKAWGAGDETALARLTPLIYDELRRHARRYARRERPGISMQTTALVNEAYVRLARVTELNWKDRTHFFAISAQIMRRILVDAARARASAKRGGTARTVEHSTAVNLDEVADACSQRGRELIAVDDALAALEQIDTRKCRIVELRFFGGLSVEETADVLGISPQTVMRDWKLAKAWLGRELNNKEN